MTRQPPAGRYPGSRLLAYLRHEASLASPYQPVLIEALVRAGGRAPAGALADLLLTTDPVLSRRARRALMRWPLRTFRRHGIADYDRASGEFVLPVDFVSDDERDAVLAECKRLGAGWQARERRLVPSRRYALIEAAGGRCQACGAPGFQTALDVDHIVPRAAATRGRVRLPSGALVDVDDPANLQVLCAACNRGKRDLGTYDFRPSLDRLAETIELAAASAEACGHRPEELARACARARERVRAAAAEPGG